MSGTSSKLLPYESGHYAVEGAAGEGAGGNYDLSFRQGNLGFELSYQHTLLPWGPFPGRKGYMMKPALWALAPGKYMHYVSFVPRGRVTGRLILPDGEVQVSGKGYHEQGRTDAPIQRAFTYWYWTRFSMTC